MSCPRLPYRVEQHQQPTATAGGHGEEASSRSETFSSRWFARVLLVRDTHVVLKITLNGFHSKCYNQKAACLTRNLICSRGTAHPGMGLPKSRSSVSLHVSKTGTSQFVSLSS